MYLYFGHKKCNEIEQYLGPIFLSKCFFVSSHWKGHVSRFADPSGSYPDPDPIYSNKPYPDQTFEVNLEPDPAVKKTPEPNPILS